MPTELVLLCEADPSPEVIEEVGSRLFPGGALFALGDRSVHQWVDVAGRPVLSVFTGRQIQVRADADRAVVGGTGGFARWVEMTVPHGDATDGRVMAQALAEAVGGEAVPRR
ncbi:MAG: hypothetical protein LBU50_05505 [Cellulomonas sp.]|jgi:hypothetical protein|nr:hypothetical protein [Cellulomonas sp.]